MIDPICSVLIPSRARPERLRKTIQSIRDTSTRAEILVRFDLDDTLSLAIVDELVAGGVAVLLGDRKNGYLSLMDFYDELAQRARAPWMFIMNDDAHVTGAGWDQQLVALPTTGLIVQPEIYQLGFSRYPKCEGGAFPIVPTRVWERFGVDHMCEPVDTWLDRLLREWNGWHTHFLDGIAVVHERDNDEDLAKHRRPGLHKP